MAGTLLHRLFHHCHLVNTRGNRCGCGGGMTWSRRSGRFLRGSTRNKCRLPKQRHLGEAARASGREPSRRRLRSAPPRPCGPPCRPTPGELAGGRRSKSAFQAVRATLSALVSRSRAMPVRGPHRENWPALQALSALVSRCRAMPVGGPPPGELAGAPSHADRVPELHAVRRKNPPGGGCYGERRLPLPVGFRPILAGVR